MMFENILVCLDGSSESEKILPYAIAQAEHYKSQITFIRVINIPRAIMPASVITGFSNGKHEVREMIESDGMLEEEKLAMDYLARLSFPLERDGINVECVIVYGTPAESITTYADQNDIDLIIIATHERGTLGKIVFGSITDYVIRHAMAPVLAIKPEYE
jgi:nucleotide-binding universal stress UspA family protein